MRARNACVRSVQQPLPPFKCPALIPCSSIFAFQAGNDQSIVVPCTMCHGLCWLPFSATKDGRPTSYELRGTPSAQSVFIHDKRRNVNIRNLALSKGQVSPGAYVRGVILICSDTSHSYVWTRHKPHHHFRLELLRRSYSPPGSSCAIENPCSFSLNNVTRRVDRSDPRCPAILRALCMRVYAYSLATIA